MASGQKARREDLKKESERRAGIEDQTRGQLNTFLGGSNGLSAVNNQNRNLYLGSLDRLYAPGAAEGSINTNLGNYFGYRPQAASTASPGPVTAGTPSPSAPERPQFYRYGNAPEVYRSDGSHVENPEQFFSEGGARDWSNVQSVAPGAFDTPTPAPVAESPAPPPTPEAPPADPALVGQTPGMYLPTGQLAKRRQLREATNRGATTWSRGVMNANLRGLSDEQADRESSEDEALSVSGARAGYDQMMRAERERSAEREQARNLAALGITSGMSSGSQGLYGGLLSNQLGNATGAAQNAYDAYDQARAQQGAGWWQALSTGLGVGGQLLGSYLGMPASTSARPPRPVAPMSVTSGNPYYR